MGEVVPARTSPTLHPPSPPTMHQLLRLALQELTLTISLARQMTIYLQNLHSEICIIPALF